MFHVKRHTEIKSFSNAKWLKKTSRRQLRSSWLSSAEEGDSPQCGEMSRRDKRAGHPLRTEDKLSSLTEVAMNDIEI